MQNSERIIAFCTSNGLYTDHACDSAARHLALLVPLIHWTVSVLFPLPGEYVELWRWEAGRWDISHEFYRRAMVTESASLKFW